MQKDLIDIENAINNLVECRHKLLEAIQEEERRKFLNKMYPGINVKQSN